MDKLRDLIKNKSIENIFSFIFFIAYSILFEVLFDFNNLIYFEE